MKREIKFEYGFRSVNGVVKKVYFLSEIPNIKEKCDLWNELPIVYMRQFTGLQDKSGVNIYEGDVVVSGNTKGVVEWNACRFEVVFDGNERIDLNYRFRESLEIIGNIHENKH